jgi:HK97 family phage prohead protease
MQAPDHGDLYPGDVHPHCVCTVDPFTGEWTLGISASGPCEVCIEAQDDWNADLHATVLGALGIASMADLGTVKEVAEASAGVVVGTTGKRYRGEAPAFKEGNPGRLPNDPKARAKKITELELGELRAGLAQALGPGWKSWLAAVVAEEIDRRRRARASTREGDVTMANEEPKDVSTRGAQTVGPFSEPFGDLVVLRSAQVADAPVITDAGILTGYALTWGYDGDGFRFSKGNFTKSLRERAGKIPLKVERHTQSERTKGGAVMETVGFVKTGHEDDIGLFVECEFLNAPEAQKVRHHARAGGVKGLSAQSRPIHPDLIGGFIVCREAALEDILLTNAPADLHAEVLSVREADATAVAEPPAPPPAPPVVPAPAPAAPPAAPEPATAIDAEELIRIDATIALLELQHAS